MRTVICPGPGKSGTTLLHSEWSKTPGFVGPKPGKEFCYFDKKQDFPYKDLFAGSGNPEVLVRFEFSPPYLARRSWAEQIAIVQRIKNNVEDPLILFSIRNPATRSISGYIHFLQAWSRFGRNRHRAGERVLSDPYNVTFENAVHTDRSIGCKLADVVSLYADAFGEDNLAFFFLETDAKAYKRFFYFLCKKIGIAIPDIKVEDELPKVLEQRRMPKYYYNAMADIEISDKNHSIFLPRGNLYIANDNMHELFQNFDPFVGEGLIAAQEYWTTEFSAELQASVYESIFREDFTKLAKFWTSKTCADTPPNYATAKLKDKHVERVPPDFDFLSKRLATAAC